MKQSTIATGCASALVFLIWAAGAPMAAHAQGDDDAPGTSEAPGTATPATAGTPGTSPAGTAASPDIDSTDLAEVLQVAIQQRPTLQQAAIDVDIAKASMYEALGLDDWIFDATGTWSSSRQVNLNLETDVFFLGGNLSRRLPTGGTVLLHADTSLQTGTLNNAPFDIYQHNISARLDQPLLRDRGRRITYAQRRRAKLVRDAAVLFHRVTAIATVREVVNAYWELAYAWRDLEIRTSSLALSRERLKNTQAGIDAGAVAPVEALAVEQSIISIEQDIIAAYQTISQRSVELRRLAGLELGRYAIDMQVAAPLTIPARAFDTDALLARAFESSPTLARLAVLEDSAKLEVELAENGLLPELALVVSIGPQGNAETPGKALSNLATFDDLIFTASLTYRRSLQQRRATGTADRTRAQLRKQRFSTVDVKAQITSELVLAIKRAEAARKRFELGARAIELAEKNVEAEKARFELGNATNFDVLQRQDELQRVRLGQARALIDFLNAAAAVDALTGDILDTYGITLTAET